MSKENSLRKIQRLITSHDPSGRAVVSQQLSDSTNTWRGKHDPRAALGSFLAYNIPAFPIRLINDSDVVDYGEILERSEDGSQEARKELGLLLRFRRGGRTCARFRNNKGAEAGRCHGAERHTARMAEPQRWEVGANGVRFHRRDSGDGQRRLGTGRCMGDCGQLSGLDGGV